MATNTFYLYGRAITLQIEAINEQQRLLERLMKRIATLEKVLA
jgi:hypothetical protein